MQTYLFCYYGDLKICCFECIKISSIIVHMTNVCFISFIILKSYRTILGCKQLLYYFWFYYVVWILTICYLTVKDLNLFLRQQTSFSFQLVLSVSKILVYFIIFIDILLIHIKYNDIFLLLSNCCSFISKTTNISLQFLHC